MDKLCRSIVEATKETLGAIGAAAEAAGAPVTAPGDRSHADTSVVINVHGELNGALALRCSQQLACELGGLMLGSAVSPGSEEMTDAVGELFNMIVGALKRHLANGHDPFAMSVPTTIIGNGHAIYVSASDKTESIRVPITCNGHDFAIEAYLDR